jgi:hypothetical protein
LGNKLLGTAKLIRRTVAERAATAATKAATLARKAWNVVMRLGAKLFDVGKLIIYHAKQIAVATATKLWALAQGAWNVVMRAGQSLLSVGKLVAYHAKQIIIAAATKTWTAAQWLWNAAMNANPIGLIIIGIAGLIAAGIWLYKNWDEVSAKISAAWQWVWNKIKAFWNWLTGVFSWDNLVSGLKGAGNWVVDLITGPFRKAYDTIMGWFGKLRNFIFGEATGAAADVLASAPTAVPPPEVQAAGGAAIQSHFANSTGMVGVNADGGIYDRPMLSWVAEDGAEAIIPLEKRSRGIPLWMAAGESMGMSFGGNTTTTNNVTGGSPVINITVNGGEPGIGQRVAEEVRRVLLEMREHEDRVSYA